MRTWLSCLILAACLLPAGCSRPAAVPGPGAAGRSPAAPVRVAVASPRDVPLELRAIGTVEAWSSVAVKSRVAGQLMQVRVRDGADVQQGEPLFEIDPLPYLEAARVAEASVARDQAAEKQARANIARTRAQAANARAQARRYEKLFAEGVGAREQADQMTTAADALDAQLNADQAALESARAALRADEARLSQARLDLGYTKITAPIAGRAGFVNVRAGNLVRENDTVALVTLLQIQPAWVVFSVPEQHLADIRAAMAAHPLAVEAVEEPSGASFARGQLEVIDNAVDPATGTIRLKARFANDGRRLWPGAFANVLLRLRTETGVLTVPNSGIQTGPAGRFVWLVKPDSTATQRAVDVRRVHGDVAVVAKGLAAGDRVVVTGQLRVAEGVPLQLLDAAPAR